MFNGTSFRYDDGDSTQQYVRCVLSIALCKTPFPCFHTLWYVGLENSYQLQQIPRAGVYLFSIESLDERSTARTPDPAHSDFEMGRVLGKLWHWEKSRRIKDYSKITLNKVTFKLNENICWPPCTFSAMKVAVKWVFAFSAFLVNSCN